MIPDTWLEFVNDGNGEGSVFLCSEHSYRKLAAVPYPPPKAGCRMNA
jgi:hypothetical protein